MTITVQENQDLPLEDNTIQKTKQIQNETACLSGYDSKQKVKVLLQEKGDYVEKILKDIIVNNRGKPDLLAIALYSFFKSWFRPNSNKKFKKSGKFDVRKYGYRTSYEELAKEFKCSTELIRQKVVLLEKLGLLARNFRIEREAGVRRNNVLYFLLWKDTPHFYFEHGLEKRQLYKPSINKKTWKEIAKNESKGSPTILGEGVQENLDSSPRIKGGGLQQTLDIIISNTTPLLHSNTTDTLDLSSNHVLNLTQEEQNYKNQSHDFSFSNHVEQEEQEGNSLEDRIIEVKEKKEKHKRKLLKDFEFTEELFNAVRRLSNKPDISNNRIIAIMKRIIANNPKTEIWGGEEAFINYMVKVVDNEKEYTKKEKANSIAEINKKASEEVMKQFKEKTITYF